MKESAKKSHRHPCLVVIVIGLILALSPFVSGAQIFFDGFDTGNPYDNGWSQVTGTDTMQESGSRLHAQNFSTNDNGIMRQNFTNMTWSDDWNITMEISNTIPDGAQGTDFWLSRQGNEVPTTDYIRFSTGIIPTNNVVWSFTCGGDCSCTNLTDQSFSGDSVFSIIHNTTSGKIIILGNNNGLIYNSSISGCNFENYDTKLQSESWISRIHEFTIRDDDLNPYSTTFIQDSDGWRFWDDFSNPNPASYDTNGCFFSAGITRCDGGVDDVGIWINDSRVKMNPTGNWNYFVDFSKGEQNSYGGLIIKNTTINDCLTTQDGTNKHLIFWHRNRNTVNTATAAVRYWNGTTLDNQDLDWNIYGGGWGFNNEDRNFSNIIQPNGTAKSYYYESEFGKTREYNSTYDIADFYGDSSEEYTICLHARASTSSSDTWHDLINFTYKYPSGIPIELNLTTPVNNSILNSNDIVGLIVKLENINFNNVTNCSDNSSFFNTYSISGNDVNLTGSGYTSGQHNFEVDCTDVNNFTDSIDISYTFDLVNLSLSIDYPTNATLLTDSNFANQTIQVSGNKDIDSCLLNDTSYFNISSIVSDVVQLVSTIFINSSVNHSLSMDCNDTIAGTNDSINMNYFNSISPLQLSLVTPTVNGSILQIGVTQYTTVVDGNADGRNITACNITDAIGDSWGLDGLNPTINYTNNATTIGSHVITINCIDQWNLTDTIIYNFLVTEVPDAPTELDTTGLNNGLLFIGGIMFIALLLVLGVAVDSKTLTVGASFLGFLFGIWVIKNLSFPSLFGVIISTMSVYFMFVVYKSGRDN